MATGEGLVGLPTGQATRELTLQWRRHLESVLGQPISKVLPESPPFAQGDILSPPSA